MDPYPRLSLARVAPAFLLPRVQRDIIQGYYVESFWLRFDYGITHFNYFSRVGGFFDYE